MVLVAWGPFYLDGQSLYGYHVPLTLVPSFELCQQRRTRVYTRELGVQGQLVTSVVNGHTRRNNFKGRGQLFTRDGPGYVFTYRGSQDNQFRVTLGTNCLPYGGRVQV